MAKADQLTVERYPDFERRVRNALVQVGVQRAERGPFTRFELRKMALRDMRIYDVTIDPAVIERRPLDIAEDPVEDYFLTVLLEGESRITQRGRELVMHPGDMALMAGGVPYLIAYPKPSRRLILRMPCGEFRRRVIGDGCLPVRFIGDSGLGRIVSNLFHSAAFEARNLDVWEQRMVADKLLDLVAATVRHDACRQAPGAKRNERASELGYRILDYMERHFADAELTPGAVAQAHDISTRYLHAVFRPSGTTVARWIWERRLEACRDDLADPSLRDRSVSEIALGRGFNDAAHFSRAFKKRFGVTPTAARAGAQAIDSPPDASTSAPVTKPASA